MSSAAAEARFQRVGSPSGPPAEVVTTLYQDRHGLLWVGSRTSLARFDGHSFVEYRHNPADPASISDHSVRCIFEDRHGDLWIGTNSGGLNRLDPATGVFEHHRHHAGDPHTLSHDSVYAIVEDPDGDLWVATQVGLNRLDRRTNLWHRYHADETPESLPHDYVTCLLLDRSGRLWAGTAGGGLAVVDRTTGIARTYRANPSDPTTLPDNSVFALAEDASGRLWVGTATGMAWLDRESGRFGHLNLPTDDHNALVVSLDLEGDEALWVGSYSSGLFRVNLDDLAIRTYRHRPGFAHGLGDDRVLTVLVDRARTVWVATWGAGLWRLSRSARLLGDAEIRLPHPDSLANRDITALASDGDETLWVGTRFGDLVRWRPDNSSWQRFEVGSGSVFAIDRVDNGNIWIGRANSLDIVDPVSGELHRLVHDPDDPSSLGPGYVNAVMATDDGTVWVGTGEAGLHRMDADGRILDRYAHDPNDSQSLSDNYVQCVLADRDGTMWIGTRSGGLNAFDPTTGTATRYQPDPTDPTSLSHHFVTDIHQDARGQLWIATGGGGLNRLNRLADGRVRFTRFGHDQGLVDANVMAILEDDDGGLWLSTKRGVSRLDSDRETFAHLFVSDGVSSTEFEPGAGARTSSALHFGSVRWLTSVPANIDISTASPSPIVVTSIRSQGGAIIGGNEPPWRLAQVTVPFGRWLAVDFKVLDFCAGNLHRYAYRLNPETPWAPLETRSDLTFTDLEPGTHHLRIRGRNAQGVWSETAHPLEIHVPPPVWMTARFKLLMLCFLCGAVFALHQARTAALRRRNQALEKMTDERENARQELASAYQRLRHLARRHEFAIEGERKRIARELHDDMGPSLTAVNINLQLLDASDDRAAGQRRLTDAMELVNRMIQQVRDLSLALRPPLLDEMGLMAGLRGYLETQADRTGIAIEVTGPETIDALPGSVEATAFRVVQEAVANVVRHADADRIEVHLENRPGGLTIVISDNGCGFDPAPVMEAAADGSALGLLGMQERVGLLGGELEIRSSPGRGTHIKAIVPTGDDA